MSKGITSWLIAPNGRPTRLVAILALVLLMGGCALQQDVAEALHALVDTLGEAQEAPEISDL